MNPLIDWLGAGGMPVPRAQAEQRSSICLTGGPGGLPCPKHVAPKWWERGKGVVAEAIKMQLAAKHAIGLNLPREDELAMCECCGCAVGLKSWTPISHIKTYTALSDATKYPAHCWIRKELSQ